MSERETWRIVVESWVSPDADWFGRRAFYVAASSLPEALRTVADLQAPQYLDEDILEIGHGRIDGFRRGDEIATRVRRKRRIAEEEVEEP